MKGSLKPRLSVLDFVSQLWRKTDFLQSCKTKSGTESLGSRLHERRKRKERGEVASFPGSPDFLHKSESVAKVLFRFC